MMWQRRKEWIGSSVDGSYVMVNVDHGSYVALNATAATVWQDLAEPRGEDAIVAALVAKFRVEPEHCRAKLRDLLDDMVQRDLIDTVENA